MAQRNPENPAVDSREALRGNAPTLDSGAELATTGHFDARHRLPVRALWLLLVLFALVLGVAGLPHRIDELSAPCFEGEDCMEDQISAPQVENLAAVGLTPRHIYSYLEMIALFNIAVCTLVAYMIFWRRPRAWIAVVASLFLVYVAVGASENPHALGRAVPHLRPAFDLFILIANLLVGSLFLQFPTGRFSPSWTRYFYGVWAIVLVAATLGREVVPGLERALVLVVLVVGLCVQAYRYRNEFSPTARQQFKWIAFALSVQTAVFMATFVIEPFMDTYYRDHILRVAVDVALFHAYSVTILLVPAALLFSTLRYRLWDVDLLIHRSLTYGMLTALLAIVFILAVIGVQGVSRAMLGDAHTTLGIGLSMLIAGSAFAPARRRLHRFVDRRWFGIGIDVRSGRDDATESIEEEALARTQALARYVDWQFIGAGGMAKVYQARELATGEHVAIKIMRLRGQQADRIERFEREGSIIADLEHPNIVKVLETIKTSQFKVIVMEFVSRRTLSDLIVGGGELPFPLIVDILSDLASALDHAHARGVVHRDLKPSNVLLDPKQDDDFREGYRCVLTDFGIAKVEGQEGLTVDTILGTVTHMSPEQIRNPSAVDQRSDVYSLGVIGYQLLTGQVPFRSRNNTALLIAHLKQPAPDPRTVDPEIPASAAAAVLRALSKKPDDRFASAGEFVMAFRGGDGDTDNRTPDPIDVSAS